MRYGRLAKVGYGSMDDRSYSDRYQITLPLQDTLISSRMHFHTKNWKGKGKGKN